MLEEGWEMCPLTSLRLAHLFQYDFYPLYLSTYLMSAHSLTKQSAAGEQAPVSCPLREIPSRGHLLMYTCEYTDNGFSSALFLQRHPLPVGHRSLSLPTALPVLSASHVF